MDERTTRSDLEKVREIASMCSEWQGIKYWWQMARRMPYITVQRRRQQQQKALLHYDTMAGALASGAASEWRCASERTYLADETRLEAAELQPAPAVLALTTSATTRESVANIKLQRSLDAAIGLADEQRVQRQRRVDELDATRGHDERLQLGGHALLDMNLLAQRANRSIMRQLVVELSAGGLEQHDMEVGSGGHLGEVGLLVGACE